MIFSSVSFTDSLSHWEFTPRYQRKWNRNGHKTHLNHGTNSCDCITSRVIMHKQVGTAGHDEPRGGTGHSTCQSVRGSRPDADSPGTSVSASTGLAGAPRSSRGNLTRGVGVVASAPSRKLACHESEH